MGISDGWEAVDCIKEDQKSDPKSEYIDIIKTFILDKNDIWVKDFEEEGILPLKREYSKLNYAIKKLKLENKIKVKRRTLKLYIQKVGELTYIK